GGFRRGEMLPRRAQRRCGYQPGESRSLRSVEPADWDVEIALGGRAYAVVAVAEVDERHVAVKDLVLACLTGQLTSKDGFVHLADEGALLVGIGELHVLLGDRGTALHRSAVADVRVDRPQGPTEIYAAVVVVIAILVGDDRFLQHLRDLGLGDR